MMNTANINIGTELYLGNRRSVYVNAGVIRSYMNAIAWLKSNDKKTRGVRLQAEGRYYLNKRKIVEPAILAFWPHMFQFNT